MPKIRTPSHLIAAYPGSYAVWRGMLSRCRHGAAYAGRGIAVCDRWLTFALFVEDMGERSDGLTIERRDNDGSYAPDNCEWVTRARQARNRRTTVRVRRHHEHEGRSARDVADELGLPAEKLSRLTRVGHSLITAIELASAEVGPTAGLSVMDKIGWGSTPEIGIDEKPLAPRRVHGLLLQGSEAVLGAGCHSGPPLYWNILPLGR